MNDKQMDVLTNLADAMLGIQGKQHTKQANFHTGTLLHGPGGIMSGDGLEIPVLTTHVTPRGLGSLLPAFPSIDTNPQFATVTGVSDEIGTDPTNPCDDAPTGYIKGCYLTARFGRVFTQTNTIEMQKTLMKLHRGDFMDLQLFGNMLNPENSDLYYPPSLGNGSGILDTVTEAEMIIAGVLMERKLSPMLWQGNPANNLGGDGYAEFPGLDLQIATGQVDAETNTACPSMDSLVVDANYGILGTAAFDITELMEEAMYFTNELANDTVGGVEGVIVMRPNMWQQLTEVWPISYNTRNSALALNNSRVLVDGRENVAQRDAMRASMTLDLNGRSYPVVVDHGINEQNNANDANVPLGHFASSIYFVPLSIGVANLPITFWQYVPFDLFNPQAAMLNNNAEFWTDGGRFSWAYEGNKWCFDIGLRVSPRVILRAPQLAWKIDNVMFSQAFHPREPQPSSPYWVDGGISLRDAPTQYAVWLP